jgi:hypothetical protein
MLRDGFLTRRWRRFSGSKPPLALARREKIRHQKKMNVSKLRGMRGTTSMSKSKSSSPKMLGLADMIIAR